MSCRNASSSGSAATSRASCVIARGIFTENRNDAGTLAAQRASVAGRCDRRNVELISAASSTAA